MRLRRAADLAANLLRIPLLLLLALALAPSCARPRTVEPFPVTPLQPGPDEGLAVDQVLLLFDSSDSIGDTDAFPDDKALLQSFVAGMPDGPYLAGAINFGGSLRQSHALAPFDRGRLAEYASGVRHLGRGTPLEAVLREVAERLAGAGGRAAIVLFSDGQPTVQGVPRSGEAELAAARELVGRHGGKVCMHVVQTGAADEGSPGGDPEAPGSPAQRREFLERLSRVGGCGSLHDAAELDAAWPLLAAQREIFLSEEQAVAAKADSDRDGVADRDDECPRTPFGAEVDARGCWVLSDLRFSLDSSEIDPADVARVDAIAVVLQVNPRLRVRIEGHTDSTGTPAYNQALSERRARTVKRYLEGRGVDPRRLEAEGFGESRPAAGNDTEEGRSLNRRIEFSVLR